MTDLTPPSEPVERPARPSPLPWIAGLALAAVVGALLFIGGYLAAGRGSANGCAAPDESFAAFCEAYDRLQGEYVDQLDPDDLAEGAIRGMFQYGVADPYSGYMPPEQFNQALGDLSGAFGGIGAEMSVRNVENPEDLASCTELTATCRLVVVAPLAGTPAEEAGIQAGDIVLAVNGEPVDGSTMNDQVTQIRGEPGTEVTLQDPARRGAAVRPHDHASRDQAPGGRGAHDRRPHRLHRAERVLGAGQRAVRRGPGRSPRAGRRSDRVRPARQPRRLHRRGAEDRQPVRGRRADLHPGVGR